MARAVHWGITCHRSVVCASNKPCQGTDHIGILRSCIPDVNELKECLSVLVKEQQALAIQSATSSLSALRLRQRLVILERYVIALNRTVFQENVKVKWKSSNISLPPVDKKR